MLGNVLSPWHLLIILVVVLIIVGPGKLPDVGQALGKAIKDFKSASSDQAKEINTNESEAKKE